MLIGTALLVSWFLFGRRLELDVRRMLFAMSEVPSVHIRAKGQVSDVERVPLFELPKEQNMIRFGLAADVDLTTLPTPTYSVTARAAADTTGAELGGQLRQTGDTAYFYFDATPQYHETDLSGLEAKWIAVPSTVSLAALFGGDVTADLDEEDWVVLQSVLEQIDLVEVLDVDFTKVFDGDVALRYTFVPNVDGLAVFLAILWERQHDATIDLETYREIETRLSALSGAEGEMWIGKKSFLLHELTLANDRWKITMSVSEFGTASPIVAPEKSTDIRQIFTDLGFNTAALPSSEVDRDRSSNTPSLLSDFPSLPAAQASGDETTSDEDHDPDDDGLTNALELFYRTSISNSDTDGDGMSDGDEVFSGRNPRGSGSLFSFGIGE